MDEFVKWAEATGDLCHYCGDKITKGGTGLDRIDSSIGYRIDNIVTCCKVCNAAKGTLTVEQFKQHIAKVHENFERQAGETNQRGKTKAS